MNIPLKIALASLVASALSASASTVYFSDDFESGLGQWNPGQGVTVAEPGHGMVLTFTGQQAGGDAITTPFSVPNLPNLYISFDYKGGGGFLGFNQGSNQWLAGENGYGSAIAFTDLDYGGDWHHYDIPIPAGVTGAIMVEDYSGASSHGAFFDNIVVSDAPGTSVPDAGSTATLLTLGFAGLSLLHRKVS